jgi:hypothetical protein
LNCVQVVGETSREGNYDLALTSDSSAVSFILKEYPLQSIALLMCLFSFILFISLLVMDSTAFFVIN